MQEQHAGGAWSDPAGQASPGPPLCCAAADPGEAWVLDRCDGDAAAGHPLHQDRDGAIAQVDWLAGRQAASGQQANIGYRVSLRQGLGLTRFQGCWVHLHDRSGLLESHRVIIQVI